MQLTAIPDTYTGNFDGLGAFTQPNNIAMNMQLSYDVSPRVQLVGTLANIFNTCWGGTHGTLDVRQRQRLRLHARAVSEAKSSRSATSTTPPGHNGSIIQPLVKYPYGPLFGPFNQDGSSTKSPFQFYVTAKIKL